MTFGESYDPPMDLSPTPVQGDKQMRSRARR
jgi:hypothetical protein